MESGHTLLRPSRCCLRRSSAASQRNGGGRAATQPGGQHSVCATQSKASSQERRWSSGDQAGWNALCVLHPKQSIVAGTVEVEQRLRRVECTPCASLKAKRRRGNGGGRVATRPGGQHSVCSIKSNRRHGNSGGRAATKPGGMHSVLHQSKASSQERLWSSGDQAGWTALRVLHQSKASSQEQRWLSLVRTACGRRSRLPPPHRMSHGRIEDV